MGTVSLRQFCETLYCAYTSGEAFIPDATGTIAFQARLTSNGLGSEHKVVFEGVTDLATSREVRRPDDGEQYQLELSVIEVEREPTGWRIWVNPWYVEEIEFHCRNARLDDADLVGEGRWLQDELPGKPQNS